MTPIRVLDSFLASAPQEGYVRAFLSDARGERAVVVLDDGTIAARPLGVLKAIPDAPPAETVSEPKGRRKG